MSGGVLRAAPAPSAAPTADAGRAALWMAGALASFSLMAVAGRELSSELNTFQIMFWRSLIGLAVVALLVARSPLGFAQTRTARPGLHAVRNLFHFFGQNCWFYAVAVIPLAQVFALEFTSPLWVALLAPLVLGERFTGAKLLAAALGFIGVMTVIFLRLGAEGFAVAEGPAAFGIGHAVALAAAIGFAGNVLATKSLSGTETTLCILFWMTLSQAVMAAVCDAAVSGQAMLTAPSAQAAPFLVAVGLCGLSAHFCMTSAFRHADATVVAPMEFFRLPLIAVVAWLLYAEPLQAMVFIGGALIFIGNIINIRAARAAAPRS